MIAVLVLVVGCVKTGYSAEFATAGPRALGMGGAQVANALDATGIYYNPAGISANKKKFDIRIPATVILKDHGDIQDKVEDLDDLLGQLEFDDLVANAAAINSNLATINAVQDKLREIEAQDGESTGYGNVGGYTTFKVYGHSVGLAVYADFHATVMDNIDLTRINATIPALDANSLGNNQSYIDLRAVMPINFGLTYGRSFMEDRLHAGITARYITAKGYRQVINADSDDIDVLDDVKDTSTTTNTFTVDLGVLYRVTEKLNVGIAAKNLTSPEIDLPASGGLGEEKFKMEPQVRLGVSYNYWRGGNAAIDIDLTENETIAENYNERQISFGVEQTFGSRTNKLLAELFTVRLGAYKNIAEDDTPFVPAAGIGLGIAGFRLDVSGAYAEDEYGAGVDIAFSW